MSQIDELISKFQEVSNHPQKTVLNYKSQGKRLVGMMLTMLRKKSYTLPAVSL